MTQYTNTPHALVGARDTVPVFGSQVQNHHFLVSYPNFWIRHETEKPVDNPKKSIDTVSYN